MTAAQQRVAGMDLPEELKPFFIALYAEGRENEALHAMRTGLACLRMNRMDLAKSLFDQAIADVESLQAGASQAQRAQSKFVREQEKWFKGESYERSALFFYRGLLYLGDGDYGNAAACFKRAQLYDVTGDDAPGFAGDWQSAEWALAFASYKQGFPEESARALERMARLPNRAGEVALPVPDQNVLLVIETGRGPVKYQAGEYGELLRYMEGANDVKQISVMQGERVLARTTPAERLYVQATTRGTRQVDSILAGKARFKEITGTAAVGLGMGAVIASQQKNAEVATGILAGLAAISALVSAATTPQADVRAWDNLPHSIFLVGLKMPEGETSLQIRAEGTNKTGNFKVNVPGTGATTVAYVRF